MKEKVGGWLDLVVYWALVLIPFSIAIAPAFTFSFIGLLIAGFLAKKAITRERLFTRTAIDVPFLAWVIVAAVSMVHSVDYMASLKGGY